MRENADQKNSEYGQFLRNEYFLAYFYYIGKSENEVEMYRHGKERSAVFKSVARMKLLFLYYLDAG